MDVGVMSIGKNIEHGSLKPITQLSWPVLGLRENPNNPRKTVTDEGFEELVASVRSQGVLQPLLITDTGTILAGHRRWVAAKSAGLKEVPVRIIPDGEGIDHELVPLLENLMRSDLSILETADYLGRFQAAWDSTPQEIARMTGIREETVKRYLKIARAPSEIKAMMEQDRLSLGAALELLRHDQSVISLVAEQPHASKRDVQKIAQTKKSPKRSYKEQRQFDVSFALDQLIAVEARLRPYETSVGEIAAQTKPTETKLAEALVELRSLQNFVVDWSAKRGRTK